MTIPTTTRKTVFVAREVPEECIARAQVVIVTANSWHILGPVRCHSFDLEAMPLPEVTCPIINVSAIPEELDEQMTAVIAANTNQGHVINVTALIEGLVKLGATVATVGNVEFGSAEWFAGVKEVPIP